MLHCDHADKILLDDAERSATAQKVICLTKGCEKVWPIADLGVKFKDLSEAMTYHNSIPTRVPERLVPLVAEVERQRRLEQARQVVLDAQDAVAAIEAQEGRTVGK